MSEASSKLMDTYPVPHPDSAGRVLDGEAVVVTPSDSKMHTLNEVGTWLWERCDGTRSVADLIDELIDEFDVDEDTAKADVTGFVRALVDRGVLEARDEPLGRSD